MVHVRDKTVIYSIILSLSTKDQKSMRFSISCGHYLKFGTQYQFLLPSVFALDLLIVKISLDLSFKISVIHNTITGMNICACCLNIKM